jgi:hypothetical protein
MAATTRQGTYLGITLTGFTALAGGLYKGSVIGMVMAVIGVALLIISVFGLYKLKRLETSI